MSARKRGRNSSSNEEVDERIELTAFMLGQMTPKGQIKKLLKEKFGITARMCEIYISRARGLIVQWSGQGINEHRIEALSFYSTVIQNQKNDLRDRLLARKRLDAILGVDAPLQHVIKGDKDNPVPVTVSLEELLKARERIAEWRRERFPDKPAAEDPARG